MIQHWLAATTCAAVIGIAPVASSPTPQTGTPAYVPCPIAAEARAVKTPPSTLSPAPSRAAESKTIGGKRLATSGLVLPDGAPALPSGLAARGWLVADLDTGTVLAACGPHEQHAPASVQKLLLAATLMDRLDPTQVVTVTAADLKIDPGSSAVGLVTGGKYSIETLWLGLLLVSGNDAANVLARVGGGEDGQAGGVKAMNERASDLGAKDTHAVTPSGLDGIGQFTSPYDLALIAKACFGRDDFRRYATTRSVQIPAQPPKYPKGFQIQNENKLLTQYRGALGGKTGFTTLARHSYVGAAERNGRRLVVTILHGEAVPQRAWQQGAALLDWGFTVSESASVGRLVKPGELEASAAAASAAAAATAADAANTGGKPAGLFASLGTPEAIAVAIAILLAAIIVIGGPLIIAARIRAAASEEDEDDRQGQRWRDPQRRHWRDRRGVASDRGYPASDCGHRVADRSGRADDHGRRAGHHGHRAEDRGHPAEEWAEGWWHEPETRTSYQPEPGQRQPRRRGRRDQPRR